MIPQARNGDVNQRHVSNFSESFDEDFVGARELSPAFIGTQTHLDMNEWMSNNPLWPQRQWHPFNPKAGENFSHRHRSFLSWLSFHLLSPF